MIFSTLSFTVSIYYDFCPSLCFSQPLVFVFLTLTGWGKISKKEIFIPLGPYSLRRSYRMHKESFYALHDIRVQHFFPKRGGKRLVFYNFLWVVEVPLRYWSGKYKMGHRRKRYSDGLAAGWRSSVEDVRVGWYLHREQGKEWGKEGGQNGYHRQGWGLSRWGHNLPRWGRSRHRWHYWTG